MLRRSGPGFWLLGAVLMSASATACLVVTDIGRFERAADSTLPTGEGGAASGYQNLKLVFQNMAPHPSQYFEFRVVDSLNNLVCRGAMDPMGEKDVSVFLKNTITPGNQPFRLDFYADQNNTRSYDGIGSVVTNDHAWRIDPLTPGSPRVTKGADPIVPGDVVTVTFVHDTQFTKIELWPTGDSANGPHLPVDTGVSAKIELVGMQQYLQKLAQVTISNPESGNVIGLYRFPKILGDTMPVAEIKGIIEPGVTYNVDLYIDANGDHLYQTPNSGDRSWRLSVDATIDGLLAHFDGNAPPPWASYDIGQAF